MHSRRGSLAARAASLALASARAPSARGARPAPSARAPAASRVLAAADAPAANTSARPLARTGLLALTAAAAAACTAAPEATHARRSETTSGATAFDRAEACAKHLETLGELEDAMEHFEEAGTHVTEVPRMLFELDRMDDLEDYVNRPEKLNAMNRTFFRELPAVMDQLTADPQVSVAVLTGDVNLW